MKRFGYVFILLAAVSMLSGCGKSEVELTEAQNDMIAEYIAGALLRYDMRYDEKLVYASEIEEEEPESSETPAPEKPAPADEADVSNPGKDTQTEQPTIVYSSLDEVFDLKGIELTYKSSALYDSYPKEKNEVFVIEPALSKKLLVAEFELSNATSEEKEIDLSAAGIKYTLNLGGKTYKSLLTALPNDLRYLTARLGAGKSQTVVVIFEVEKDAALKDAELMFNRGSINAKIKL